MRTYYLTALLLASCLALASAGGGDVSCFDHVQKSCLELGAHWEVKTACSSTHGGFEGNSDSLHKMMADHFSDSFKLLQLSGQFDTDQANRLGMHKLHRDLSSKMWSNAKDILKYILKRGGRVGQSATAFKIRRAQLEKPGTRDELSSLAVALDVFKERTEDIIKVHESTLKRTLDGNARVFDPATSHFLEEKFLSVYAAQIRELVAHLNLLGSITRDERNSGFARHLYDESLL